jgi:hypothetical protein
MNVQLYLGTNHKDELEITVTLAVYKLLCCICLLIKHKTVKSEKGIIKIKKIVIKIKILIYHSN